MANPEAKMIEMPRAAIMHCSKAECMVTQFKCHDDGLLKGVGVGQHTKEWQVQVGDCTDKSKAKSFDVRVSMDRGNKVSSTKVRLEETLAGQSQVLYPQIRSQKVTGASLTSDLNYEWNFRGSARTGKEFYNVYEVKEPGSDDRWWPAWLENETHDGKFDATLVMPKQFEQKVMPLDQFYAEFDEISKSERKFQGIGDVDVAGAYTDVRFRDSHGPLCTGCGSVKLCIPEADALHKTTLDIGVETDGVVADRSFLQCLGRPSPARTVPSTQPVSVVIDKERKHATVPGMAAQQFQAWVEQKVCWVGTNHESKSKVEWVFRIGLNEHKIALERKKGVVSTPKLVTLLVDGEVLVEATPEHLAALNGAESQAAKATTTFKVEFDFKTSRDFSFNLWKVNRDGITCGDGPVDVLRQFFSPVKVIVFVPDVTDLSRATLAFRNGAEEVQWQDLQAWSVDESSEPFQCEVCALETYYCKSIPTFAMPWPVDKRAASGLQHLGKKVWNHAEAVAEALKQKAMPSSENVAENAAAAEAVAVVADVDAEKQSICKHDDGFLEAVTAWVQQIGFSSCRIVPQSAEFDLVDAVPVAPEPVATEPVAVQATEQRD